MVEAQLAATRDVERAALLDRIALHAAVAKAAQVRARELDHGARSVRAPRRAHEAGGAIRGGLRIGEAAREPFAYGETGELLRRTAADDDDVDVERLELGQP